MDEHLTEQKEDSFFKETIRFALITLAIVVPIRFFIAEPFIVSGESMVPTFANGNYLIVDRLTWKFEEPKRGEVVIFRYPRDTSKYFIKRIVGLPGDTVTVSGSSITITNAEHPDGFSLDQSYIERKEQQNFSTSVPPDSYFVLGDNRPQSSDSRTWGFVPRENMIGRALVRLFPFTQISLFPGSHVSE